MVELTAPYIPGFLAFREVSFLVEKVTKVFNKFPQFTPQVSHFALYYTEDIQIFTFIEKSLLKKKIEIQFLH